MENDFPILEYDPDTQAIISPNFGLDKVDFPETAVACFFHDVIDNAVKERGLTPITCLRSEMGTHPIYEISVQNKRVAFFHPGIGAPFAAGLTEEVMAHGAKMIIACGGAGTLVPEIKCKTIVIPTSAVRDEGTSYHYLPPAREVYPGKMALEAIKRVLNSNKHDFLEGKTWTTDGLYRETTGKIKKRASEGCLTVEMEAAALFAVGQFREVEIAQVLYAGDDVSSDTWDPRNWNDRHNIREALFWLALEACATAEI